MTELAHYPKLHHQIGCHTQIKPFSIRKWDDGTSIEKHTELIVSMEFPIGQVISTFFWGVPSKFSTFFNVFFFFAEWWLTLNELRAIFMMGWQRQRFWQSVFGWFREPQEKTYGYGSKPGEPCGEPQICRDLWMSIWQIWYLDSDPSQVFCMTNIPRNTSI